MLDVQYPRSSFSQSLLTPGSSSSHLSPSSHYWSEHSFKRRNIIGQDIYASEETRSHKSSTSAPSARQITKNLVELAPPAASNDNMNGSGYTAHQAQVQGYSTKSSTSTVDARTYYATPTTLPQSTPSPHATADLSLSASRSARQPEEPEFLPAEDLRANNGSNIASYLQLPKSISGTGGSLAQFAAETTCIFWFESLATLQTIEQYREGSLLPFEQMSIEAYPQTGFLKWVTTILSTTQVTQNVILMALSFIHKLKKLNPTVRGKLGSEYRLLTVALMLGNKFLDDNTYTNKTWAEVSGISVHEIHVMEMEFLSHLKYNLYMSKEEWLQWHKTLSTYFSFLDRLAKIRSEPIMSAANSRRSSTIKPYHLPSPPTSLTASPAYTDAISPQGGPYTNRPIFNSSLPSVSLSQMPSGSGYVDERKRSYEIDDQEPAAKRQSTYGIYPSVMVSGQYGQPGAPSNVAALPSLPILPTPNLSVPPTQQQLYPSPYHYVPAQNDSAGSSKASASISTHLPPLNWPQMGSSNGSTPQVQQQQQYTQQNHQSHQQPQQQQQYQQQQQQQYQQPYLHQLQTGPVMEPISRHHTPLSARSGAPSAFASQAAHTMMPNQLSPSYFLHRRSSPYRPVRNMNTLLNPPPSASMHRVQQNIPQEQMRWQPLGKNVEERTGRLPYYQHYHQQQQQGYYNPQPPSSVEFNFTPNQ